jgi:hypothetical protein
MRSASFLISSIIFACLLTGSESLAASLRFLGGMLDGGREGQGRYSSDRRPDLYGVVRRQSSRNFARSASDCFAC